MTGFGKSNVLRLLVEVAERREEVDHGVEPLAPGYVAHVSAEPLDLDASLPRRRRYR